MTTKKSTSKRRASDTTSNEPAVDGNGDRANRMGVDIMDDQNHGPYAAYPFMVNPDAPPGALAAGVHARLQRLHVLMCDVAGADDFGQDTIFALGCYMEEATAMAKRLADLLEMEELNSRVSMSAAIGGNR